MPMVETVAILAGDGAQVLDVTGPSAVFSTANTCLSGAPRYHLEVVSLTGGLLQTTSGVSLFARPIHDLDPSKVGILLVSGHDRAGTHRLIENERTENWVRSAAQVARLWGSVCSGSFVLAAWGLLEGRRATTHWDNIDELVMKYPEIEVDRESLFVVDGNTWTSAGVTAGIDMSLAIVESDLGSSIAAEIAQHLVLYLRRPGGQSQFSGPIHHQRQAALPYDGVLNWAKAHLNQSLTIEILANKAGQSPRTFQRRFKDIFGQTPAAYIENLRLERAKTLIQSGVPLKIVAADIGYSSASQLSNFFQRRVGLSPSVWRRLHGASLKS